MPDDVDVAVTADQMLRDEVEVARDVDDLIDRETILKAKGAIGPEALVGEDLARGEEGEREYAEGESMSGHGSDFGTAVPRVKIRRAR